MRYLMLVCGDGVPTPEKAAAMRESIPAWLEETERRGVRLTGHALADPQDAATVRVRDDETLVTDGPFAESKEHVGGFDVLECADLDEAIEIAAMHPVARFHAIEVRPFRPLDCPDPLADERFSLDKPIPAGSSRYALFMCLDGIPATDEEEAGIIRDGLAWREDQLASGRQVFGQALAHANDATTVRVRDGETLLSDGPFVETKEFIGGIDVVDCASRDEAVAVAARHPLAAFHMVEVRPFASDPLGDGGGD